MTVISLSSEIGFTDIFISSISIEILAGLTELIIAGELTEAVDELLKRFLGFKLIVAIK